MASKRHRRRAIGPTALYPSVGHFVRSRCRPSPRAPPLRPSSDDVLLVVSGVDTLIAQAGGVALGMHPSRDGANHGDATGSVIPPIFPSTTYARRVDDGAYDLRTLPGVARDVRAWNLDPDAAADVRAENHPRRATLMYSRPDNPTYVQAESVLAALDGGVGAALFSSGMAAAAALATALLRVGDRVAFPLRSYFAIRAFFHEHCERSGVEFALYDCAVPGDLARAAGDDGKCALVWVETPANPTWEVTDLRDAAAVSKSQNASLCVDATVLTPLCFRPVDFGADFPSCTPPRNTSTATPTSSPARSSPRRTTNDGTRCDARAMSGAVLGPFEAWLLCRGMRTLAVRVPRQCRTAETLARRFDERKDIVREVLYPGLPSHPGHAVALAQAASRRRRIESGVEGSNASSGSDSRCSAGCSRFGAREGEAALRALSLVRVWCPATSLGGVESLAEHRWTLEGEGSPTPDDLLRLSVGLEDPDDLFEDLAAALEGASRFE